MEKDKGLIPHIDRSQALDGLRGIAVLFVFLSHTSGRDIYVGDSLRFHGIGHIGVYLFFVLSAFLLGKGLFSREINSSTCREFYIKRFFRIVPLYYFVLIALFFFQFYGFYDERYLHVKGTFFNGFLYHFIFLRGDSVMWSIITEMQFYIVAPLLAYILVRWSKGGLLFLLLLGLTSFIFYYSEHIYHWGYLKYVSPNLRREGTYIDVFIMGLLAAYFLEVKREWLERYRKTLAVTANILFVITLFCSLAFVSDSFLFFDRPFYDYRYISLMFGLVFAVFIVSIQLGNTFSKFLDNSILRTTGVLGYSIYLLHMPVFQVINLLDLLPWVKFIFAVICVWGVSFISYRLVEKTSIKLSYQLIGLYRKKSQKFSSV